MGAILLQITLRGQVSPVGGIKEKVLGRLGAHCTGANRVILPWANRKDEHDVAKEVRTRIQFITCYEDGARGARCCLWTWLVAMA